MVAIAIHHRIVAPIKLPAYEAMQDAELKGVCLKTKLFGRTACFSDAFALLELVER